MLLSEVLSYYRVCPFCQSGCGAWNLSPIKWLCKTCQQLFLQESHLAFHRASIYEGPIYSLISWKSQNHTFISTLVQSLKGNHNHLGWSLVVQVILREMILKGFFSRFKIDVVVPAPSHNPQRQHAQVLAKALSRSLGVPTDLDLLQFKENSKNLWFDPKMSYRQTFKSKPERANIKMIAKPHLYKNILFVDDICTTGATITAAKKALGECRCFQPLVLAYRMSIPLK